ncbi:hypothetical protein, variant [Aphanomyces astaci]|uniref:Phosphatidic acid phosphatase type 2/haloperoxidase domain-containing protein n=1 Tax=Aphanomyces astaci TaxID=112090 RepID=W4GMT4_APHAT|nr:hypothetical protein, variant [Aphanomyces astaci]ETV80203.1 hypothetical protein, variant [Aphanomyces astaci]|eukprot:XP_009830127.1 hypothetical protein, variant [Aphanomyces astaci]
MKRHAPPPPAASLEVELETKPILAMDFQIVWWLYDQSTVYPNIAGVIRSLVSRYRTQDISILLWLFFFYLVTDLGIPYFYTCVGNLVVAAALQHSINAKRPIDYDDSLYIHACTDPDTTGFPSIDSHMAIVVITPALTSNSVSALTFSLMAVSGFAIAFTRVFVGVRFPSQIVGSWGTGLVGLVVANFIHVSVLHHAAAAVPPSFQYVSYDEVLYTEQCHLQLVASLSCVSWSGRCVAWRRGSKPATAATSASPDMNLRGC